MFCYSCQKYMTSLSHEKTSHKPKLRVMYKKVTTTYHQYKVIKDKVRLRNYQRLEGGTLDESEEDSEKLA